MGQRPDAHLAGWSKTRLQIGLECAILWWRHWAVAPPSRRWRDGEGWNLIGARDRASFLNIFVVRTPTIHKVVQPKRKRKENPKVHRYPLRVPTRLWNQITKYQEQRKLSLNKVLLDAVKFWWNFRRHVWRRLPKELREKTKAYMQETGLPLTEVVLEALKFLPEKRREDAGERHLQPK